MEPQTNTKKGASHLVRFPLDNFKFFELSFQSSLQLSLAVLVCYRSFVGIFSLGWNLPPILRLHSQATRLMETKEGKKKISSSFKTQHRSTTKLAPKNSPFISVPWGNREGRVNIEQDFNPL